MPEYDKRFLAKIARAQKFVLASDFAQVCDELVGNLDDIAKTISFCRLPYKLCWIEVVHNDRPRFAHGLVREWQKVPSRVGYLLEAVRDDLSAWDVHLCWRIEPDSNCAASVAITMDTQAPPLAPPPGLIKGAQPDTFYKPLPSPEWERSSDETKAALTGVVQVTTTEYGPALALVKLFGSAKTAEMAKVVIDIGRADWAGEPHFLLATLAMLNARNASETVEVDNSRYNAKRAKQGKHALFDHKVLTIHARQKARMKASKGDTEYQAMRRHFVRGHWKVRRTGIFFWRPYQRGTGGFVQKDYRVTA